MPQQSIVIETGSELYAGISTPVAGSVWEGHSRNDNLILSLTGAVRLLLPDTRLDCPAGTLIYLPPGGEREFCAITEWTGIWCHFDLNSCGGIRPEWGDHTFCRTQKLDRSDRRRIYAVMLQLCREVGRRRTGWRQLGYLLISEVLLRGNIAASTPMPSAHIQLAVQLLSRLKNPVPIDEIADRCGMSHAAFYRKFKETFAMSPRRYRENEMMRQAKYWLERSDMTLPELADKLGCSSSYYLSSRFKRWYGIAPSDYRRTFRANTASAAESRTQGK